MSIPLANSNPQSNSGFVINIEGVTAYFTSKDGGKVNMARADYMDGQSATTRKAASSVKSVDDVTIKAPLDYEVYAELIDAIKDWECDDGYRTISVTPVTRCNGLQQRTGGFIEDYVNCRLVSSDLTGSIDLSSGTEVAMIELVFAAEDRTLRA